MTDSPPSPSAGTALPPLPTAQEVQQQADDVRRRFEMELQQRYMDLWRFMAPGPISVEEKKLYLLLQQCYMDRMTPGDCQATVFRALMCPHCGRNITDVPQPRTPE